MHIARYLDILHICSMVYLLFISDSVTNGLSGHGAAGFSDGDLASAMFSLPRSFAVDLSGNVYVADKNNHAIRKIVKSGVTTTIAGGFSGKTGNVDGPAQNASFSEDFELAFVPDVCALLITDRGNRLVRQMKLKAQDCASASPFQLGAMGALSGGFASLVLGLAFGLAAPYLVSCDVTRNHRFSETWKHCQINLMTQIPIIFSDIRNEVASSAIYSVADKLFRMSLSHLSLIFRIGSVEQISSFKRPVSLLNPDCLAKDLISFDEDIVATEMVNKTLEQGDEYQANEGLACNKGRLDSMMHANMLDFAEKFREKKTLEGSLGLIKRK